MSKGSFRRQFLSGLVAGVAAGTPSAAAQQVGGRGTPSMAPAGLGQLFLAREGKRRRSSSWNRTGQNADRAVVDAGKTAVIADIAGAGCVRHIWITIRDDEPDYLRRLVLRAYWDGEASPSVESPIGDFFGVGHARVSNYWSLPLNMVTGGPPQAQGRAAMNCFFPMPFGRGARLEVENQGRQPVGALYYYVDYEEYAALPADALRFHAQWRRENPTRPSIDLTDRRSDFPKTNEIVNLDGRQNYVIMEATGRGHYVGCNLSIDHLNPIPNFGWFGEGDDMIFIDGEAAPSLVGTGTEDYFCAAWGYPGGFNSMPYHGISLAGPTDGPAPYSGKWTMYRYHVEDPVMFTKSIKVTIEHGHGNVHASDYSSVGYWYQTEPHAAFPPLPPVEGRLPLPDRESLRRFWRTF
ncbi:MAG: glycoside hydrolase family 172 protein [Acidobacteriota bacterium]